MLGLVKIWSDIFSRKFLLLLVFVRQVSLIVDMPWSGITNLLVYFHIS